MNNARVVECEAVLTRAAIALRSRCYDIVLQNTILYFWGILDVVATQAPFGYHLRSNDVG